MSVSVEILTLRKSRVRPLNRESSSPKNREWINFIRDSSKKTTTPTAQIFTAIYQVPDNEDIHYCQKKPFSITINKLKPIRPWKPAKQGTTSKFAGMLTNSIPELSGIPADQLDDIYDQSRKRE